MKKLTVTLLVMMLAVGWFARPASALLPFNKEWTARYVTGNGNAGFVTAAGAAKCNVCHDPNSKSKKDHNPYGKVVKKFLSKAEYEKVKGDAAAAQKYILDGLQKAEAEKAEDGKTYGEKIKAGTLPGG